MKTKDPLYIQVYETSYSMFGMPTIRNLFLARMVKVLGGINEGVQPGTYIFTMKINKKFQICTSLNEA